MDIHPRERISIHCSTDDPISPIGFVRLCKRTMGAAALKITVDIADVVFFTTWRTIKLQRQNRNNESNKRRRSTVTWTPWYNDLLFTCFLIQVWNEDYQVKIISRVYVGILHNTYHNIHPYKYKTQDTLNRWHMLHRNLITTVHNVHTRTKWR